MSEVWREVPGRAARVEGDKPVPSPANSTILNPDSTLILLQQAEPSGDFDLPTMPTSGGGDLRESFDLPMMTEAAPARPGGKSASGVRRRGARPPTRRRCSKTPRSPAARRPGPRRARRPGAAIAAASCRPVCRLCQKCGLDLDTGVRVDLTDDLSPPPPPKPPGPSIPMIRRRRPLPGGERGPVGCSPSSKWNAGRGRGDLFRPGRPCSGSSPRCSSSAARRSSCCSSRWRLGAVMDLTFMIGAPIIQANEPGPRPSSGTVSNNDDPDIEGR